MFKYVVIEGIDGAGKTTFINILKNKISKKKKEIEVFTLKEPLDREFINMYLPIKLFDEKLTEIKNVFAFALDRVFVMDKILNLKKDFERLKNSLVILADRSFVSSMAYQFNIDYKWIFEINKNFLMPNLVVYLDVCLDVALERIKERNNSINEKIEYYEKKEMLKNVKERYAEVLDFIEKKGIKVKIINANLSVEELEKEAEKVINSVL